MSLLYREEIDFKLAKENPWTKGVMTILGHYLYATHSCFMLTNVSCDDIENDVLLENVTLRWWFKRASSTNRSINLCPALRFEIAFEEIVSLPRARPSKQHPVENDRDPLRKQILLKYRRILIRGTLRCPLMYSSPAIRGPAPLHVLVPWPTFTPTCLSLCLRDGRSITPSPSLVRRRLSLATGRPDLIFSKLRGA